MRGSRAAGAMAGMELVGVDSEGGCSETEGAVDGGRLASWDLRLSISDLMVSTISLVSLSVE